MAYPIPIPSNSELSGLIDQVKEIVCTKYESDSELPVIPSSETLESVSKGLVRTIPQHGFGLPETFAHLESAVLPGLSNQASRTYLGFVTGGVTPAALVADYLVSVYDQNAHRFGDSVAAAVEDAALEMVLEFLDLNKEQWPGRIITTGATASNVLALAVAREHLIRTRGGGDTSKIGILRAMSAAGLDQIQVLHSMSHSSIAKACSILGLGSDSAESIGKADRPWDFDLAVLEDRLSNSRAASIVVVGFGEVNTGLYTDSVVKIRSLCDKYGAWLHIDGAFGIYSRALRSAPGPYQAQAIKWTDGLEHADSITGDSHKSLNVPYDSGFFFCKNASLLTDVFRNPGAAYLAGPTGGPVHPLNKGIENSRRFRGLPLYATLLAYGSSGYRKLLEESISAARLIAAYIEESGYYTLLPEHGSAEDVSTVVLFRAADCTPVLDRINETRRILVTPTVWNGQAAVRVAVSNWRVSGVQLAQTVIEELSRVASFGN